MKKLLLIILILFTYSYSQENRIVRQQELSDSLDAVRLLIGTGGVPLPDSVIYESELSYVNVTDYGAVGDSTDATAAFQLAINTGKRVYVPKGVYVVDSLVMSSNSVLFGDGVSSKICLSDNDTILIKIKGESGYYPYEAGISGVKIENLWLSGVDNSEIAGGYPLLGDRVGIYIDNATNTTIKNCKITGFSLAGILSEKTNATVTYTFNTNVSNCLIQSNYYGIWIKEQSEYGFYHNNLIQGYYEGVKLIGGNNAFSNNQIINGITGLRLEVGVNDSHGSFTGGSINHNTIAIQADSIRTGFEISNINLWYGAIIFNYAREVRIMNSKVYSDSIVFKNGDCANSGFINCTFKDDVTLINRDKGTDQSIMKNNNFFGTLTGLTDQSINDVEFTPTVMNINGITTIEYNANDSSYTEVASNTDVNFGTKDFTIEWFGYIKPDGTYQYLVKKGDILSSPAYTGYYLSVSSVNTIQLLVYGADGNYTQGDSPEITEGFYHIVATKQDTVFAFYINGDSTDELYRPLLTENAIYDDYSGANTSNTRPLLFSTNTDSSYFHSGGVNLIRLYNFGVSGTQAHNMYAEGQSQLSEVPYKYKWGNQDSLTSGTLVLGKTYIIDNYVAGDDFTNIGGTNADSSIFIATGTTPTTWTNSSILRRLGCVAEYKAENSSTSAWFDNSTNNLDGTHYNIQINKTMPTLPNITGITAGFIPKVQSDGSIAWEADAGGAGSDSASYFSKDGTWHPTDSLLTIDEIATTYQPIGSYATASHTHTEFFDTLSYSINIPDTVIAGDNAIWKVPNNITIVEVSAFTNSGTVTFNIEERGETTPNTAGTDVMTSDLVADTDQQETTTFSNATLDKNDWMALAITSITGDPTLFGVTIYYVKTN